MVFEFIINIYQEYERASKRKYGLIFAEDYGSAMGKLGDYFGNEILEVVYFGCCSEDEDDNVYILNDDWSNHGYDISGRKFRKMIPEVNDIPRDNIVE